MSRFQIPDIRGMDLMPAETVASAFESLVHTVERAVPEGRDRSLVMTKLEEAFHWAIAGIARD